ncbi:MAG TPA: hypothetical protein VGX78_06810, partial [Pirellulales bacterium]|nr:hypothetical protein [Pirellulales bacterium]
VATVTLVAAAPYLLSWAPLANAALSAASWRIHGRATVGQASLGWFSPPALTELEVQSSDGSPLVTAPSVVTERPLWQIVVNDHVGQVRLERPEIHLVLRKDGSNLEDVLGRRLKVEMPPDEAQPPDGQRGQAGDSSKLPRADIRRGVDVHVVDLRIAWRTPDSQQEWNVDGINLAFGLRPAWTTASGSPELIVEHGTVIDHCRISQGMCNDVLHLVAPVLNKVTTAKGEFTIELDDWRLPLDQPQTGKLAGRLSLHEVVIESGSFVRQLAEKLRVEPMVELARESVVTFELRGGCIHHRDLEFRLPPLRLRSSGSVGFDESLDMLVEVAVELPEGIMAALPSARELTQKTLRIPITGTLSKPRIDTSAMGDTDLARVIDKLQQFGVHLARKHKTAAGDDGQVQAGKQSDDVLTTQAANLIDDLAKKWTKRGQSDEDDAADGDHEPGDEMPPKESKTKKALDRVLEGVRKLKK